MALSLLKTTVNNANGAYTPNMTLSGHFKYYLTGDITLNTPTGLLTDNQLFVIELVTGSSGGHQVTWSADYYGPLVVFQLPANLTILLFGYATDGRFVVFETQQV